MDENPYQAPQSLSPHLDDNAPAIGVRSGRRKDLRRVVRLQRAVVAIMWVHVPLFIAYMVLAYAIAPMRSNWPMSWQITAVLVVLLTMLAFLATWLASIAVVVLLTARFWPIYVAALLGLVALAPVISMAPMFIANFKARRVLRANGIPLGTFWAHWPSGQQLETPVTAPTTG